MEEDRAEAYSMINRAAEYIVCRNSDSRPETYYLRKGEWIRNIENATRYSSEKNARRAMLKMRFKGYIVRV